MFVQGVMISTCGPLILGKNYKYSLIVNRIRRLNEEKEGLLPKPVLLMLLMNR